MTFFSHAYFKGFLTKSLLWIIKSWIISKYKTMNFIESHIERGFWMESNKKTKVSSKPYLCVLCFFPQSMSKSPIYVPIIFFISSSLILKFLLTLYCERDSFPGGHFQRISWNLSTFRRLEINYILFHFSSNFVSIFSKSTLK